MRKDKDKDKVNRVRKDVKEPLRLWPKTVDDDGEVTTIPFKGMVATVPLLEWCVRRKYKPDARTFEATARGGDMDAIRWLREHKCPWDGRIWDEESCGNVHYNACDGAAEGGHLDVLKWLRQEGCPWDERTCADGAYGGHLHIIKWARQNGCPWNEDTCMKAAEAGHLDVLKYLRERECPWDEGTCGYAIIGIHTNILRWARANGCPGFFSRAQVRDWLDIFHPSLDDDDEFDNQFLFDEIVDEFNL